MPSCAGLAEVCTPGLRAATAAAATATPAAEVAGVRGVTRDQRDVAVERWKWRQPLFAACQDGRGRSGGGRA
eukprot:3155004-Alexandrium_andersonii.AAC.1